MNTQIAQLAGAGVKVGAPERSGRTRPDGVTLAWETAIIGDGPRGSFFPFLIRDFTPREKRVYPSGKPTTAKFSGIALVVIGVRDLNEATARYRKAFGLREPLRQRDEKFGADIAWFEGRPSRWRRLIHRGHGSHGAWRRWVMHHARLCWRLRVSCRARRPRSGSDILWRGLEMAA